MDDFFVVVNRSWLSETSNPKRLGRQYLFPLGRSTADLELDCRVLVKFRDSNRKLQTDNEGRIREYRGIRYLYSKPLSMAILEAVTEEQLFALYFEGTPTDARCVVQPLDQTWLDLLIEQDPTLRLSAYELPPSRATTVTSDRIVSNLYDTLSGEDPELYAVHVSQFLDSPHILTPLFAHISSLRSEDNLTFVIELKKAAEQIRGLLVQHGKTIQINQMERSHLELWSDMQDRRVAFLDGGAARIPGVARLEPMAIRIGVYSVVPGERETNNREQWFMKSFVIGDCIDPAHPITERTDRRRLMEASRYILEPLVALANLREGTAPIFMLLHGPLVNQFAMYDEGRPHFLPALDPAFLEKFQITKRSVTTSLRDLPENLSSGGPFWNQFMAVYAYLMKALDEHQTAVAGVVERVAGRSVTRAVLATLVKDKIITQAYERRISQTLEKYDISDDFLFGCVLREGEYLSPITISKNLTRRGRERWRPVIDQIPMPAATMIKTAETSFPFRVEMNQSAAQQPELLLRLIFHTARLLPRYAFPVGLDIADKYAKVPDWLARGVSAEMSGAVIRRALQTGDPAIVSQVRQLLARSPRDFFFRPSSDIERGGKR